MKKTYYIPIVEVIDMMGEHPIMIAASKGYWPAPKPREDAVF